MTSEQVSVEAKAWWDKHHKGSQPKRKQHYLKGILLFGAVVIGAISVVAVVNSTLPPTTCDRISVSQMNSVYQNSLPGKMGLKVLDILNMRDIGSSQGNLRCQGRLLTTHGEMTFSFATRTVNGTLYLEMMPILANN